MYKRFVITEEEKKEIKVLYGLLEQDAPQEPQPQTEKKKEITIPFNFPQGFWSAQKTDLPNQIQSRIQEIVDFLKNHQYYKIIVKISAGESKITNKDKEGQGPPYDTLREGELARRRAESLKRVLQAQFQSLISQKIIRKMPVFTEPNLVIGVETTPGERAFREQFVRATIIAEYIDPVDCIDGLIITADYKKGSPYPFHDCGLAMFKLFANDIYVGILNLNNNEDKTGPNQTGQGKSEGRVSSVTITKETAKQILEKNPNQIELKIVCNVDNFDGCHSDPIHITITKPGNEVVLEPQFLTIGVRLKYNTGKVIATLDRCGYPLSISK